MARKSQEIPQNIFDSIQERYPDEYKALVSIINWGTSLAQKIREKSTPELELEIRFVGLLLIAVITACIALSVTVSGVRQAGRSFGVVDQSAHAFSYTVAAGREENNSETVPTLLEYVITQERLSDDQLWVVLWSTREEYDPVAFMEIAASLGTLQNTFSTQEVVEILNYLSSNTDILKSVNLVLNAKYFDSNEHIWNRLTYDANLDQVNYTSEDIHGATHTIDGDAAQEEFIAALPDLAEIYLDMQMTTRQTAEVFMEPTELIYSWSNHPDTVLHLSGPYTLTETKELIQQSGFVIKRVRYELHSNAVPIVLVTREEIQATYTGEDFPSYSADLAQGDANGNKWPRMDGVLGVGVRPPVSNDERLFFKIQEQFITN